MEKPKYSPLIGFWKSLKNVLVTVVLPGVIYLGNTYTEWLPEEYYPVVLPVAALLSHFSKNWIKNK